MNALKTYNQWQVNILTMQNIISDIFEIVQKGKHILLLLPTLFYIVVGFLRKLSFT